MSKKILKKMIIFSFILFLSFLFTSLKGETMVSAEGKLSPSKIIIVTDKNRTAILNTKLSSDVSETYDPSTRRFVHMACGCQTGNRIWVGFNSGGRDEPNNEMYAVFLYSDDFGKTWVDPAIIIDTIGYSDYSPYMFVDEKGKMWITWNRGGTYALVIDNPEDPMDKITYTEKGKILPRDCSSTPIILKDGTWLACMEGTMPNFYLYGSTDKGESWNQIHEFTTKVSLKNWNEGYVCELSDGTLMYESRIETGDGQEIFYSTDKGKTWTDAAYYLGKPFISCHTKGCLITLSNGNLVWCTNDNTYKGNNQASRINTTIWMSKDDGKTWSDGLLLDKSYSEYPYVMELNDGRLFAIWTRERLKCVEMRSAILTQDDVFNSEYTESKTMMLVARGNQKYSDIVSTNLPLEIEVKVGTSLDDVKASLPQYIKITNEFNQTFRLEAKNYVCSNYDASKEGTYRFECIIDSDYLMDIYDNMHIDVIVGEKKEEDPTNRTTNKTIKTDSKTTDIKNPTGGSTETNGCLGTVKSLYSLIVLLPLSFVFVTLKRNIVKKKYE